MSVRENRCILHTNVQLYTGTHLKPTDGTWAHRQTEKLESSGKDIVHPRTPPINTRGEMTRSVREHFRVSALSLSQQAFHEHLLCFQGRNYAKTQRKHLKIITPSETLANVICVAQGFVRIISQNRCSQKVGQAQSWTLALLPFCKSKCEKFCQLYTRQITVQDSSTAIEHLGSEGTSPAFPNLQRFWAKNRESQDSDPEGCSYQQWCDGDLPSPWLVGVSHGHRWWVFLPPFFPSFFPSCSLSLY